MIYRAYISYSHKDEAWAAWLLRAIESYRVPRYLVGKKTSGGSIPARIRPVFRDRDDLSSASDLEGTVKQALRDSENLILVCSPDAAASRWVNEEIRQFASLGRADRVFCIIVGGEPVADGSVSACFPSALAEIGLLEPLAADVRDWADGKHVAKLKLIAGLLNIRLDELRQRDLQRRRKRQTLFGFAAAAVLSLAVIAVTSRISERHEREKAEQLATFVVDLGERLKSDADLETLALIGAEASRHLQGLDPDRLSPELGEKVALALRQMGGVSELQGKPVEALAAYQRSRDLLAGLHDKYPDIPGLLFELGNAEFYIGNLHNQEGRFEPAIESMQIYHRLTRKLLDTEPDNPDWILEVAYAHNNLAALQLDNGKGMDEATLEHITRALSLMETVVSMKQGDQLAVDAYSNTLAWAADAQFQACNLKEAMDLRTKVVELASFSSLTNPGNNDLKMSHAFALTGVASMQIATGRNHSAEQNIGQAISMFQQLFAADRSNVSYSELMISRQVMLLELLAATGQWDSARLLLEKLESVTDSLAREAMEETDYIELLLANAGLDVQLGNMESASQYIQTAIQLQLTHTDFSGRDIFNASRLARARYQWWKIHGRDFFESQAIVADAAITSSLEFRSCTEVDSSARMYVIKGDRANAVNEVAYLESRGYADPGFIRFCQENDLCGS